MDVVAQKSVPSVAVCLVTCERYEYTRLTIETFSRYNDLGRFVLLHADDASDDPRICRIANEYGFATVSRSTRRLGNVATIQNVVSRVEADWLLLLENDWESVRPFPWSTFETVVGRNDIYCLRLCGAFKERGARPFEDRHAGKGNAPVVWEPFGDDMEVGSVHWGHPPAVTRKPEAEWLLSGAMREKDARLRSGQLDLLTARVKENVFYHIGEIRTPAFKR